MTGVLGPPGNGGGRRDHDARTTTTTDSAKAITPIVPGRGPHSETALSAEQQAALDEVARWFRDPRALTYFRLFGYAGTGKTTLAKLLPELLGVRVQYAAFTGKAASVLRDKGCDGARTIHSILYRPDQEPVIGADGKPLYDADGKARMRLVFRRRTLEDIATDLSGIGLLVVDEVSMVSREMVDDLLALGLPILVLGDPEQLPPVGGRENQLMAGTPDVLLEQIHRAALHSPVTRLATRVRLAHPLDPRLGMADNLFAQVGESTLLAADQVLAWKNVTRWRHIRQIRSALGRPDGRPVVGDVITFLKNRPELGLFNGQQATVVDVLGRGGEVLDLPTDLGPVAVDAAGFLGLKGEEAALNRSWRRGGPVPATFGQVSTVHKAQGSEWGRVLVLDETAGIRGMESHRRSTHDAGLVARRWLYTGITRASQQVCVAREVMA
jgi:exodeoxyribonuclease-5